MLTPPDRSQLRVIYENWRMQNMPLEPTRLGTGWIPDPKRSVIANLGLCQYMPDFNRNHWYELNQRLRKLNFGFLKPKALGFIGGGINTQLPLDSILTFTCAHGITRFHQHKLYRVLDGTFKACDCISKTNKKLRETPDMIDPKYVKYLESNSHAITLTKFYHPLCGRTYNNWQLSHPAYYHPHNGMYWFCRCTSCNAFKSVRLATIFDGRSTGCADCRITYSQVNRRRQRNKRMREMFNSVIQSALESNPDIET